MDGVQVWKTVCGMLQMAYGCEKHCPNRYRWFIGVKGAVIKFHWLTPDAADPWSLTINLAQIRVAGGGGAAPPHTPCIPGGSAPWTPQKALRALGCRGWSLSHDRATCPGQLRCLGQNFCQKIIFFVEEATCPGQLRCLGQNFCQKSIFLEKPLVPGSFAAWGSCVSQETDFQEFWDPCAQNKTSEISKNELSGIMGLLCAEQNVGTLKK